MQTGCFAVHCCQAIYYHYCFVSKLINNIDLQDTILSYAGKNFHALFIELRQFESRLVVLHA